LLNKVASLEDRLRMLCEKALHFAVKEAVKEAVADGQVVQLPNLGTAQRCVGDLVVIYKQQ